ncbi:MAG: RluA family pseudouridine synthase [Lachnospiraceae bacterium]|nr:RluA family pseudouridine synthase [Lachnospiraceae bacterium]
MQKNIVFEDEHIIVAYKPAGIATQTARLGQQDMVSELKNYLARKPENKGKGEPYLGLVHRLDQPVAGILAFAKTKQAAASLSKQITEGTFHKYYYAIVYGRLKNENGTLNDYLYKDGKTNMSLVVKKDFPEAKEARLFYQQKQTLMVLEAQQEASLVEIELFTGRHHQIRVQMANADMPLLGDSKYGTEESKEFSREIGCRNVALCACKLVFKHPATNKEVCFEKQPEEEIFKPFLS